MERLVPDAVNPDDSADSELLKLHMERYQFGAWHARPGRLLDIACGAGYGTRLLAEQGTGITEALGVDLSPDTVEYARKRYQRPGLEYRSSDAMKFEDTLGFDTIVSLETIEHVPDPVGLIDRLLGLLRPNGVFIASVPTTPSAVINPFHLHDFTERSFRKLVDRPGLREIACLRQSQPYSLFAIATRKAPHEEQMRQTVGSYYLRNPRAAIERVAATLRYGFTNRYLTTVWRRVS